MVFSDASITSGIIIFNKIHNDTKAIVLKEKFYSVDELVTLINDDNTAFSVELKNDNVFALIDEKLDKLNSKIDAAHQKLCEICKVGSGMQTGANDVFCFDSYPQQFPKEFIKKRVVGEAISRYVLADAKEYLLYFEHVDTFDELPQSIKEYLLCNREILENRADKKRRVTSKWWNYTFAMHKEYYYLNKIWCSYRGKNNAFIYDAGTNLIGFTNTTVIFAANEGVDLKFILTLINSKLLNYRYKTIGKQTGSGVFEYFENGVGKLPIPIISKEAQQPFIELADKMLFLNSELQTKRQIFLRRLADNFTLNKGIYPLVITGALARFEEINFKQSIAEVKKQKITLSLKEQVEWEMFFSDYKTECCDLVQQIEETDRQIDGMVYELYGLTEEEIEVVENNK
jgi:hypothetical protein